MNIEFRPVTEVSAGFGDQFDSHSQVDHFLNELIIRINKAQTKVGDYEAKEAADISLFKSKKKELADVTTYLEFIQESLDSLESSKFHSEYKHKMYDYRNKKMKLELWMQDHNPIKDNNELLEYQLQKANLQYTMALATALCEWFATGAAGPGTLTFNGNSYTAS